MRKTCVIIVMSVILSIPVFGQISIFEQISIFGQKKFKNGYIVTLSKDTIFGKIQNQNSDKIVCKFQNSNGEVIDYQPNEISAFGYTKKQVYTSKKLKGQDSFIEYLVKGELNLYYQKEGKKERFFLDNQIDSLAEIELTYEEIEGATGMKLLKRLDAHIELLLKYTEKVPDLKSKIKKIDRLEADVLVEIAKKHNRIVCNDKKCNSECCKVFRNGTLEFGFEINPVVGFNSFATKDFTFTVGALGYYKLPKCDNKLFIKSGFLCSPITKVQKFTKQKSFIQFPIQFEARYPLKYFRPKVALGVNLSTLKHFDDFYTSMLSFGVDVPLQKKLYVSLNYDINFEPLFLIIPLKLSSHSLLFGVNFMF